MGGPNFHEIPINRPIAPMHNNQRDGHMRQEINKGQASYHPNSLGNGCPFQAKIAEGGFDSYPEKIDAKKIRERSRSFMDHFSQATLFFKSQSQVEQQHIIDALKFELGKVETLAIRERMLGLLTQVDDKLVKEVAEGLGLKVPSKPKNPMNHGVPADAEPGSYEPTNIKQSLKSSNALSMKNTVFGNIATRQVAFLCADGVDALSVSSMKKSLEKESAMIKIIAPHAGEIKTSGSENIKVDQSFLGAASVLFDAFYVPAGEKSINALKMEPKALYFLNEGYKHCKALAFDGQSVLLEETFFWKKIDKDKLVENGVILNGIGISNQFSQDFINVIGKHRFWNREKSEQVPA